MPGHVSSWGPRRIPRLRGGAPGPYQIARSFGVFDPAFDPTRDSTYKFIDTFVGEISALFPDAYWHIGGDENNAKQWQGEPGDSGVHEEEQHQGRPRPCRPTSTSGCSRSSRSTASG